MAIRKMAKKFSALGVFAGRNDVSSVVTMKDEDGMPLSVTLEGRAIGTRDTADIVGRVAQYATANVSTKGTDTSGALGLQLKCKKMEGPEAAFHIAQSVLSQEGVDETLFDGVELNLTVEQKERVGLYLYAVDEGKAGLSEVDSSWVTSGQYVVTGASGRAKRNGGRLELDANGTDPVLMVKPADNAQTAPPAPTAKNGKGKQAATA